MSVNTLTNRIIKPPVKCNSLAPVVEAINEIQATMESIAEKNEFHSPKDVDQWLIESRRNSPFLQALRAFQEEMKGEAEAAGLYSPEDVDEWITESRRKERETS